MTPSGFPSALRQAPWRYLTSSWPWRGLLHVLISALLGAVLWMLLPVVLLLAPLVALPVGALERWRQRLVGSGDLRSAHVELQRHHRPLWLGVRLSEPATWREVCALLVDIVLGLPALALLLVGILSTLLLGRYALTGQAEDGSTLLLAGLPIEQVVSRPAVAAGLLLALLLGAYLLPALAAAHATIVRPLCSRRGTDDLPTIEHLTRSRETLLESITADRRRIEGLLHDGAQQEVVALGARLALLDLELDVIQDAGQDVGAARRALEEARTQADRALASLRDTVRGIHPAVLTDHGLAAALQELAHRTAVPLTVQAGAGPRPPVTHETAAYYLVSEAASNAAKHAAATGQVVQMSTGGGRFTVRVRDDGIGGADPSRGSGLRGLRERAEALGGDLTVLSPPGGPTVLTMTLPVPR